VLILAEFSARIEISMSVSGSDGGQIALRYTLFFVSNTQSVELSAINVKGDL
jgi:hypothetical protein